MIRSHASLLATVSLAALGHTAPPDPLPEQHGSSIGYATVEAALSELRAKPGVEIREERGWTIVVDNEAGKPVIWSFSPAAHPAHPSAVKRFITEKDGAAFIEMRVLCQADKLSCDALVREFQALNENIKSDIKDGASTSTDRGNHREVNITTDSEKGWLPSEAQQSQIPWVVQTFLTALDAGEYAKAFDLMSEGQRQSQPFDEFAAGMSRFNSQAGQVKERRIVKVTWTKDPGAAPAAGIYAAVDLRSRFENIDRHCGYIMLYQPEAGAPFLVGRREDNYIANEHARQIEKQQSRAALDQLWSQLSKNCPNYAD